MKRFFTLLAALLCVTASAQEIRDISTTVYLFRTGNALIVQRWDLNVTEGTEWYIPVDNLGQSKLTDFCVYENDVKFVDEGDSWNSSRPMEAKAGRSGIVRKSGGDLELCWGLGSYGDHDFHIMYVIENMVQDYGDCDGFHWHFLNDQWSVKPQHASITFQNETDTEKWFFADKDSCNVRFWGFGMAGESSIEDGVIRFESTEPFSYGSFFSALMQFDKGLFKPRVKGKGSFEALKEEAMEGSNYKSKDQASFGEKFERFLDNALVYGFLGVVGLGLLWILYRIFETLFWIITGRRYDKKVFGRSAIKGWWRDIPLGGNPTALYSILYMGDKVATNPHKRFPNLVSAYFLKWIQEGLLLVERDEKKEDRVNLRFVQKEEAPVFTDNMEERVYNAALQAAGKNLLLEENEFRDWSNRHDTTVDGWPSEAAYQGRDRWEKFSEEERCHAVEFRNYLSDFTLVDQRQAPEVGLWKQYMVLAAAMGIADKVAKNFEKLFPKVMEEYSRQSNMTDMATSYLVMNQLNRSSSAMVSSAHSRVQEREAARKAAERRSSGGGGSISIGGGGGGFGGGHGGGAR